MKRLKDVYFQFCVLSHLYFVIVTNLTCEQIIERNIRFTYSVRDCDYVGNYSFYRIDETSGGFMSWNQGKEACHRLGGDLASIRNFQEYRLGLNDRETEGLWQWCDRGDMATYFQWQADSGAPHHSILKNCVAFYSQSRFRGKFHMAQDGFWDEECQNKRYTICKLLK